MELKPINKNYEKPDCPTETEVKLNLWTLLGRSGKISLGVAVAFLLCVGAVGCSNIEKEEGDIAGGLTSYIPQDEVLED